MEIPSPTMQRALRQAQLYGYLVVRDNRLYYPGGINPVCNVRLAREMMRSGWLILRDNKFEITAEGWLATIH